MQYEPHSYSLSDFDFDLPEQLIAQKPSNTRTTSRLLNVNDHHHFHNSTFAQIIDEFVAGDVLVINNTKVMPARLFGTKHSGGKVEVFVERIQSDELALCMIRANRPPKVGSQITINNQEITVKERDGMFFLLSLTHDSWAKLVMEEGDIPLPPYIHRQPSAEDLSRYQTVYAEHLGAVAAPTAGLHFDNKLLNTLKNKGVIIAEVTLHVGAGTFLPVKEENLDQHIMHFEQFYIPEETQEIINAAKTHNRRVTAVGTTSIRALESAADNGLLTSMNGDTNLFIRPGYSFQIVDRLITNFHLPKSSLMMLVSAFAGYDTIKKAYQFAINENYRFFSYGDAMLLNRED